MGFIHYSVKTAQHLRAKWRCLKQAKKPRRGHGRGFISNVLKILVCRGRQKVFRQVVKFRKRRQILAHAFKLHATSARLGQRNQMHQQRQPRGIDAGKAAEIVTPTAID